MTIISGEKVIVSAVLVMEVSLTRRGAGRMSCADEWISTDWTCGFAAPLMAGQAGRAR